MQVEYDHNKTDIVALGDIKCCSADLVADEDNVYFVIFSIKEMVQGYGKEDGPRTGVIFLCNAADGVVTRHDAAEKFRRIRRDDMELVTEHEHFPREWEDSVLTPGTIVYGYYIYFVTDDVIANNGNYFRSLIDIDSGIMEYLEDDSFWYDLCDSAAFEPSGAENMRII